MAFAMATATVSAMAAAAMTTVATNKATRMKGQEKDDDKPGLRECGNYLVRWVRDATSTATALQVALNVILLLHL